jgi:hypothetical protein
MKPTMNSVKNKIEYVYYAYCEKSTVCFMKLKSGHMFVGESHCYSFIDYDVKVGRECAYDDAVKKLFEAECYLAKNFEKFIEGLGANTNIPEPISGGVKWK